jgi:hypothetical protein
VAEDLLERTAETQEVLASDGVDALVDAVLVACKSRSDGSLLRRRGRIDVLKEGQVDGVGSTGARGRAARLIVMGLGCARECNEDEADTVRTRSLGGVLSLYGCRMVVVEIPGLKMLYWLMSDTERVWSV